MLTNQDLKSIAMLLKVQKEEILGEVDIKLSQQSKELLKGIAEYIQDELIPLFDDHEERIVKLEKHTNHPPVII